MLYPFIRLPVRCSIHGNDDGNRLKCLDHIFSSDMTYSLIDSVYVFEIDIDICCFMRAVLDSSDFESQQRYFSICRVRMHFP